ncbi:COX assembly mitochondrial protein 2 homolog [Crassostrea virginica]
MHPDLSAHLHTDECNVIIKAYKSCQEQHLYLRFFGYCDPLFTDVQKCLRKERINRRIENRENNRMKMRAYREKLAKEAEAQEKA